MTPEYASPEQLMGQVTTTASDIYSLGVVLYELLAGAKPFRFSKDSAISGVEQILTTEPPLPSRACRSRETGASQPVLPPRGTERETAARLRGDLDNIVMKSIRREPEERYASAQDLGEDLRRHLEGLPVSATADSRRYRLAKFVRRNGRLLVPAAAAVLLVIALSIVSVVQAVQAKRERDLANERFQKLRDVARLLTTDTSEALHNVPGTLFIRKSLAEKSVELLAGLDDVRVTDPQFLSSDPSYVTTSRRVTVVAAAPV